MDIANLTEPKVQLHKRTKFDRLATAFGGATELMTFIDTARAAGDGWRTIAKAIAERTEIIVSHQSIADWYQAASTRPEDPTK